MSLYYKNLFNKYKDYRVIIIPPTTPLYNDNNQPSVISGIINTPDTINLSMDAVIGKTAGAGAFIGSENNSTKSESEKIFSSVAKNTGKAAASMAMPEAYSSFFVTPANSIQMWQPSQRYLDLRFSFNIFKEDDEIYGIEIGNSINSLTKSSKYREIIGSLSKMTQTIGGTKDFVKPSYMDIADYFRLAAMSDTDAIRKYTWSVQIGDWFNCASLLLPTEASIAFSQKVDKDGDPLYATVNIAMTSYRILTGAEYAELYSKGV